MIGQSNFSIVKLLMNILFYSISSCLTWSINWFMLLGPGTMDTTHQLETQLPQFKQPIFLCKTRRKFFESFKTNFAFFNLIKYRVNSDICDAHKQKLCKPTLSFVVLFSSQILFCEALQ